MKVWIDADACPKAVREIVFRAAHRRGIEVVMVADKPIPHEPSPLARMIVVEGGVDAADERIAEDAEAADVLITADIPLAGLVVRKGAVAIDIRGSVYDERTIVDRLPVRNLIQELRASGEYVGGGPAPFSAVDRRRFANALDRILTARSRSTDANPGRADP